MLYVGTNWGNAMALSIDEVNSYASKFTIFGWLAGLAWFGFSNANPLIGTKLRSLHCNANGRYWINCGHWPEFGSTSFVANDHTGTKYQKN